MEGALAPLASGESAWRHVRMSARASSLPGRVCGCAPLICTFLRNCWRVRGSLACCFAVHVVFLAFPSYGSHARLHPTLPSGSFFFACFCVCLAAFVALFSFIEGVTLGALPFPEIENLYLPSSPLSGSLRGLYLLI